MNIKSWLKQIPLIGRLGVSINTRIRGRHDQRNLKLLSSTSYLQGEKIKDVLRQLKQELPQAEQDWITRIEEQRKALLSRNELLIDGSLGEGRMYDKDITVRRACQVSKPHKEALMLYLLIRAIKPRSVIELGTNVGISSSFIGAALKVNEEQGSLTTLELSPNRLRLAKEVHSNLGLDNVTYVQGLFKDTLSHTLGKMGSVDLAFIDGHHQYKPTLDYYEEILRIATADAVFVFDDIRWSDGMKKAWSEIQADKRLGLVVDLDIIGICVHTQETVSRRYVIPSIYSALR
jgi:predicted O-methyltransferase YrrM